MIDHLVGRPSPSWKRTQVFLVILFWLWRIMRGNAGPPRMRWLKNVNKRLRIYTPWQIILSTLTTVYTLRNLDKILGLGAPEPLAHLYSPSYYRATWISTGLDAGFATAMPIRPKWLRDLCSVLFSMYYIIYANEADEKLRRFRAVPTVEILRTCWEKTTNPYLRLIRGLPHVKLRRRLSFPRPTSSAYDRPISGYLFFDLPPNQLAEATELILDFPGGGFVAMNPEHHEERLRMWATTTRRPVLAIDYGKAPEYPYPFAIDEAFDTYRALVESAGRVIGMSGRSLKIIISGDSAGATLAVNVVIKILETNNAFQRSSNRAQIPLPTSLVLSYAALDFNFTSWMTAENLKVLRTEQSSGNLPGLKELAAQKNHLQHVSPLSMVVDKRVPRRKRFRRKGSWKEALRSLTGGLEVSDTDKPPILRSRHSTSVLSNRARYRNSTQTLSNMDDQGEMADSESDAEEDFNRWDEEDRPIQARIRYKYAKPSPIGGHHFLVGKAESMKDQDKQGATTTPAEGHTPSDHGNSTKVLGTRLTMTSRTGYFQDRIVSPSMMRAMAILYIGPHQNPDFSTDYYISPILTPKELLAQFPPLLMQCGEKDPFVDDTVIFAGRVREAKRARKIELDLAIAGKSARFGESLRMSEVENPAISAGRLAGMKRERDKLANETEDDWVEMVLFSDWSHGYLQMPALMREAKDVIIDLAEWINDAFVRHRGQSSAGLDSMAVPASVNGSTPVEAHKLDLAEAFSPLASETETDDPITFAPRRHQDRAHPGQGSRIGERGDPRDVHQSRAGPAQLHLDAASSGSDTTLINRDTHLGHLKDLEKPSQTSEPATGWTTPDPGSRGTPTSGQRPRGQRITETELMRRRRLLDSHIFE
ncbi:hypothetical protein AX16_005222 [Volvariella volvacea WC 439]|nr:hypothetical protein AX16_005222 [Volvariella volvacea WC 439]